MTLKVGHKFGQCTPLGSWKNQSPPALGLRLAGSTEDIRKEHKKRMSKASQGYMEDIN